MHSLPVFLRLTGRPVILVGNGPAAEAKRRLLDRAGAMIVSEDAGAALAIVVDDDAAVARLKARGILVNAVDRAALCDFTLPAIVDRDPVLVAIGTGGASAGLAKALRQRLETLLPAGLGRLAEALHGARETLRARLPDATDRRRAIDAALDRGGPLDPLVDGSDRRAAGWAAGEETFAASGLVTIHLRSSDPDDLSFREARLLGGADRIYHSIDTPILILNRARADAECILGPPPDPAPPGANVLID